MRTAPMKFALFAAAAATLLLLAVVAWQWSAKSLDAEVTAATPSDPTAIDPARVEQEIPAPLEVVLTSVRSSSPPEADARRVQVSDELLDQQPSVKVTLKGRIDSS